MVLWGQCYHKHVLPVPGWVRVAQTVPILSIGVRKVLGPGLHNQM